MPLETEKDIDRLCQENLAYVDMDWKIFDQNISCDIYKIDKPLGYISIGLSLESKNPLRRVFNYK